MSWFRPKKSPDSGTSPTAAVESGRQAALGPARDDLPQDDDDDTALVVAPRPDANGAATPARVAPPPAAAPAPRPIETPPFDPSGATRLGDDTTIVGGIVTASDLWVSGGVEGDISSGATVVVAAEGTVVGNVAAVTVRVEKGGTIQGVITADNVTIGGAVHGPVRASARLAIAASGSLLGDVSASSIQIDDGGTLQGRCTMARR